MKKFTLMAAFAAMTLGAAAQNVAVTSNVTEGDIENGATVTVPWHVILEDRENKDSQFVMFEWNPHFTVRALAGKEDITVYATSSITAQLCWPISCQAISPDNTVNANGSVNTNGSDIQFDRSITYDNINPVNNPYYGLDVPTAPAEDNYGTGCLRVVDSDNNEIVINVIWSVEDLSGVKNIANDIDMPAEYYSLTGLRVTNPKKGIYIVKRGNKVTREVIK